MSREMKFRAWSDQMYYNVGVVNNAPVFIHNCIPLFDGGVAMQWTGLQDKNGKDIYEGDILTNKYCHGVEDEDFCEVRFAGGGFVAIYEFMSIDLHEDSDDLEIVGNIYENPEILEEDE